jgi:suppressor of G2 allele of SKP1
MADRAAEGLVALKSHDYPKAIACYTAALHVSPSSPDYYLKRSTAHQRSTPPNYHGALWDADMAVVAATRRAKRELIAAAQLRRAIALYCLERYGDAAFLFDVVKELDPKEKSLAIHQTQTKAKLAALPEGDERANITVVKLPDIELSPALPQNNDRETADSLVAQSPVESGAPETAPPSAVPQKIKHEWYQSSAKVHLTILAKGVLRDSVTVDIQESMVCSYDVLYIISPARSTYHSRLLWTRRTICPWTRSFPRWTLPSQPTW